MLPLSQVILIGGYLLFHLLGILKVFFRDLCLTLRSLNAQLMVQSLLHHEFSVLFRVFEEMLFSLMLLDRRLLHNYIPERKSGRYHESLIQASLWVFS